MVVKTFQIISRALEFLGPCSIMYLKMFNFSLGISHFEFEAHEGSIVKQ